MECIQYADRADSCRGKIICRKKVSTVYLNQSLDPLSKIPVSAPDSNIIIVIIMIIK